MLAILDHIGIAVKQLPELKKLFELLGLQVGHVEDVPEQGVRTHFLKLPQVPGKDSYLEFLEVLDPQGTIAKFMEKRGPGIHHLSFRLPAQALVPLSERLRAEGYRLIYDEPRNGAHQMWINFIHPASAGGLLIELMEPQS